MQKMEIRVPGKGQIVLELEYDGECMYLWGDGETEMTGHRHFNAKIPYLLYKALEAEIVANSIGSMVASGKIGLVVKEKQ